MAGRSSRKREKRRREALEVDVQVTQVDDEWVYEHFGGGYADAEPLTPELIAELTEAGELPPPEDLQMLIDGGYRYDRSKREFRGMPQIEWSPGLKEALGI